MLAVLYLKVSSETVWDSEDLLVLKRIPQFAVVLSPLRGRPRRRLAGRGRARGSASSRVMLHTDGKRLGWHLCFSTCLYDLYAVLSHVF